MPWNLNVPFHPPDLLESLDNGNCPLYPSQEPSRWTVLQLAEVRRVKLSWIADMVVDPVVYVFGLFRIGVNYKSRNYDVDLSMTEAVSFEQSKSW